MIIDIKDYKSIPYFNPLCELLADKERFVYILTFGCQQNEADSEKL